jgi:hypothetical protein
MAINLKTFAKDLTYQANTSVRQIFKDLKELAEIKQLAEQKAAYFSTWGLRGVGLILFAIFMWFFALTNLLKDGARFGFIMLVIPIVIATIFCAVKWNYYQKLKFGYISLLRAKWVKKFKRYLMLVSGVGS